MSYQSSQGISKGVPADLVIVASLAAAFSMFVAGYSATRASLGPSSSPTATAEDVEVNVVAHQGTLWEDVGHNAQ